MESGSPALYLGVRESLCVERGRRGGDQAPQGEIKLCLCKSLFSLFSDVNSLCLVSPYKCEVGGCHGVGGRTHQHVLNTVARLQSHPSTVGISTSLFSLRSAFFPSFLVWFMLLQNSAM